MGEILYHLPQRFFCEFRHSRAQSTFHNLRKFSLYFANSRKFLPMNVSGFTVLPPIIFMPCIFTCGILSAVKGSLYLYGGTDKESATSCAQGLFQFERGTCISTMISFHASIQMYMYMYMYIVCMNTRTKHVHTHTYIHTNTCTCTHTHIHRTHTLTYKHARTHTQGQTHGLNTVRRDLPLKQ